MPVVEGQARPIDNAYNFLRAKLGDLFFINKGTPIEDLVFVNLIRLRALFEITGDDTLLRGYVPGSTKLVSIHDIVWDTKSDQLGEAVDSLFGKRGTVGPNPRGEIGTGQGRADSRTLVDRAVADLNKAIEGGAQYGSGARQKDAPAPLPPKPAAPAKDPLEVRYPADKATTGAAAGGPTTPAGPATGGGAAPRPAGPAPTQQMTGDELLLAPGGAEVWRVGRTLYLAYQVEVPGQPPITMTWRIRDEKQLAKHTGPGNTIKVDRTLTPDEYRKTGAINFGTSEELANYDEHPLDVFEREFEMNAAVQPYLRDPEVLALVTGAILEGREVTAAELASTDYFKGRSAAEIEWVVRQATDPQAARDEAADARRNVEALFRAAGVTAPPDAVIDLLADRWVSGQWSESFVRDQIRGLSDPFSGVELAPDVARAARGDFDPTGGDKAARAAGREAVEERVRAIYTNRGIPVPENFDRLVDRALNEEGYFNQIRAHAESDAAKAGVGPALVDTNRAGEEQVKQLILDWLGPLVGKHFLENPTFIGQWASKLRETPDAQDELVEILRAQRLASFPKWTNPNARYVDIAGSAKSMFLQIWGQEADETDPFFADIVQMTDLSEAAKKLRTVGLDRGVETVRNDAMSGLLGTSLGQQIIPDLV